MLRKCGGRLRWEHLDGCVVLLLLLLVMLLMVLRLLKLLLLRLLKRNRRLRGGRRIAAKLLGHLAHDARERRVRRPRAGAQFGMPDNVQRRRRGQPRVLQTSVAEQQRGRRLGEGGAELAAGINEDTSDETVRYQSNADEIDK